MTFYYFTLYFSAKLSDIALVLFFRYGETVMDRADNDYTKTEALSLLASWLKDQLLTEDNVNSVVTKNQERLKSIST